MSDRSRDERLARMRETLNLIEAAVLGEDGADVPTLLSEVHADIAALAQEGEREPDAWVVLTEDPKGWSEPRTFYDERELAERMARSAQEIGKSTDDDVRARVVPVYFGTPPSPPAPSERKRTVLHVGPEKPSTLAAAVALSTTAQPATGEPETLDDLFPPMPLNETPVTREPEASPTEACPTCGSVPDYDGAPLPQDAWCEHCREYFATDAKPRLASPAAPTDALREALEALAECGNEARDFANPGYDHEECNARLGRIWSTARNTIQRLSTERTAP